MLSSAVSLPCGTRTAVRAMTLITRRRRTAGRARAAAESRANSWANSSVEGGWSFSRFRFVAAQDSRHQRVLGAIGSFAYGASHLARDAVGKIKPSFSDDEKTRLVGGNCGSFGQIETGAGQSPILKFRTHFWELA